MSKELITQLSDLKMKETALKRCLDKEAFSSKGKSKVFKELTEVQNKIKSIKFKLRLEKELKK